jgi:MFS family permease
MLMRLGFLVIYAKFSDVFGKKTMLIFALTIFTLFSILCGAANGIVELLVLLAPLALPI